MFDVRNPDTWTPADARTAAGTLRCICGAPGLEFYVDGVIERDGQRFGVLRGACSDEHWAAYKFARDMEALPEQDRGDYLSIENQHGNTAPVSEFGPLFG